MDTRFTRNPLILFFLFVFPALMSQACRQESVPEAYLPSNAYEAYIHALEVAGLAESALARDWVKASQDCLEKTVIINTPFEETFYVDSTKAFAVAYRFEIKRGQRTEIEINLENADPTRVFMDLFRTGGGSPEFWVKIASANKTEYRLEVEPRITLDYALRIQPELLRGGRFTVTIRNVPSLGFPVEGARFSDIGSWFGDPRDGGRREHHGVDIFPRRHTPVIAPSDARVRRVREGAVGGRTVWLRDEKRNLNLYFAHLQEQKVEVNDLVKKGQVIGTVGNTGNARTTPPHLHFAIYIQRSGAVDPVDFLRKTNVNPIAVTADLHPLGQWARAKEGRTYLLRAPASRSERLFEIDSHTPMKILAAATDHYRVFLPDGQTGYVVSEGIESLSESLEVQAAAQPLRITESPTTGSVEMDKISPGQTISILALFRDYWLVRTEGGLTGWAASPTSAPTAGRVTDQGQDLPLE